MKAKRKPRTVRVNNLKVYVLGEHREFGTDLYHTAMTVGLGPFIAGLLGIFVLNNIVFALLYALDGNAISNVPSPHLLFLFFFSVESFTTVGYGDMHPQDAYGHVVASVEGFASLVQVAALTGVIFARFSRPQARIRFAKNPVIAQYEGSPTLMIRLANSRLNQISDATATLWALRTEKSAEGHNFRRFHQLRLSREQNPVFTLSWTLFHPIDANSILHGLTMEDYERQQIQLILTIKGTDDTSAQELHARKSYDRDTIVWGHRYADILNRGKDDLLELDYHQFDKILPVPKSES